MNNGPKSEVKERDEKKMEGKRKGNGIRETKKGRQRKRTRKIAKHHRYARNKLANHNHTVLHRIPLISISLMAIKPVPANLSANTPSPILTQTRPS